MPPRKTKECNSEKACVTMIKQVRSDKSWQFIDPSCFCKAPFFSSSCKSKSCTVFVMNQDQRRGKSCSFLSCFSSSSWWRQFDTILKGKLAPPTWKTPWSLLLFSKSRCNSCRTGTWCVSWCLGKLLYNSLSVLLVTFEFVEEFLQHSYVPLTISYSKYKIIL